MSGELLLDTCAAMFMMADEWMRREAEDLIDQASDRGDPLLISPITAWEIGNLRRKGRFKPPMTPQVWWRALLSVPGMRLAPLDAELLLASSFLPEFDHGDPADRIIAATAREFGHIVVTRDRPLLDYGRAGHLRVVAC